MDPERARSRRLTWLIAAAVGTALLWGVPFGALVLYPFTILATWFHEMSHGLTALALGGQFEQLRLFADGSGVATHSGEVLGGPLGNALVAAAGPMGPPLAGAVLILASRRSGTTRLGLALLGLLMVASLVLWVHTLFGIVLLGLLAVLVLGIALHSEEWVQTFTIQFLGVQACISTFHQVDYLFMHDCVIGGQRMLSDTGQVAQALLLPYWFWGALMAVASVLLLAGSLWLAYRRPRQAA